LPWQYSGYVHNTPTVAGCGFSFPDKKKMAQRGKMSLFSYIALGVAPFPFSRLAAKALRIIKTSLFHYLPTRHRRK
jgi:hypothetical protein